MTPGISRRSCGRRSRVALLVEVGPAESASIEANKAKFEALCAGFEEEL